MGLVLEIKPTEIDLQKEINEFYELKFTNKNEFTDKFLKKYNFEIISRLKKLKYFYRNDLYLKNKIDNIVDIFKKNTSYNEVLQFIEECNNLDVKNEFIKIIKDFMNKDFLENRLNEILNLIKNRMSLIDIIKLKQKKSTEIKNNILKQEIYKIDFLKKQFDEVLSLKQYDEKFKNEIKNKFLSILERFYPLKYFDSKSILMEVEKITGNKESNDNFTLIINIEVEKSKICEDFKELDSNFIDKKRYLTGYKNLKNTISEIYSILNNKITKKYFKQANIYKSLGQKDITVIIEEASVNNLNDIIDKLNTIDSINRTFSIYCSKNKDINVDEDFTLSSYIRVPKNRPLDDVKTKLKSLNANVYKMSGVMDYRINWVCLKSIKTLFDHYESLYEYISDYQTKIEKKI